ncbi:alpha-1,3-mannosyl-glycoprotein 4-beta-N-acetylglucosaminyltransferase C-like [Latimeria chalumnae]|uniref:Alpha-1,3-mannosyl-glycoprotein 4-beta-N-acetylglucosaminyltransferase C n=1 Tax=Latimeria chalumnae TaxID=7897 RepID=H3B359_LATCH
MAIKYCRFLAYGFRRSIFLLVLIAFSILLLGKNRTNKARSYSDHFVPRQAVHTLTQVTLQKERIQQNKTFSIKDNVFNSLRIPYQYLLSTPPKTKRYLSIGISSVKRQKENYLLETIRSIFSQSSPNELEEMVLVIYLANFDASLNIDTAEEIETNFAAHINASRLIVITCSKDIYPTLEGLKRNFNDADDRVRYRSKQNVDYAFLANFCANISDYYLILEDDVICARNFLTVIKKYVTEKAGPSWTTLTFSKLGYIGKLYHNEDLPKLARFLLMFYDEMPCDWLLEHFHQSKAQKEMIRYKPSLFQHVGFYSSFRSTHNELKDDDFQELAIGLGDNPPASCYTDIEVYEKYGPEKAYENKGGFFWGKSLTSGSTFNVVFHQPISIQRLRIFTGSAEHRGDILQSGYLDIGKNKNIENGKPVCKDFSKLGNFINGNFEMIGIHKNISDKIDCLRIQVNQNQANWLIINSIDVWVLKS